MPKSNTVHLGRGVYIARTKCMQAWQVCKGMRVVRIVDNYSFALTLAGQLWQGKRVR